MPDNHLKQKLDERQLVRMYVEALKLSPVHSVLGSLSGFAVGFWFLCPLLFGEHLPPWVYWIIVPPVMTHLCITLPKHFDVIAKDPRLEPIRNNPFLAVRCSFAASKPTKQELEKYPWLESVYRCSFWVPLICFVLLTVFFVIPSLSYLWQRAG